MFELFSLKNHVLALSCEIFNKKFENNFWRQLLFLSSSLKQVFDTVKFSVSWVNYCVFNFFATFDFKKKVLFLDHSNRHDTVLLNFT